MIKASISEVSLAIVLMPSSTFFNKEFDKNISLWKKFEEARNIFYQGNIEQSKILFEKISNELPVAKKYFERCEITQTPIQENLKGIWVATEK